MRPHDRALAWLTTLPFVACACAAPAVREDPPLRAGTTVWSDAGLVVSVDRVASEVGARVLARGGNAVDAAIATAFALAVTHPRAGNLGGGGFMLVRLADGRDAMIDYREVAPAAATQGMYRREDGSVHPDRSIRGYLAPGVPGTVPGLELAHREFGTLPWEDLVEPAVRLAEQGIVVDEDTARSLEAAASVLRRFPASAEIFLPGGEPPRAGDRLVQRDLAWSLGRIAREGASAVTCGEVARRIVASVRRNGGILTRQDLAGYRPVLREPLRGAYRGHELILPTLPSSGGVAVLQMLHFLEHFDVTRHPAGAPETVHLLAEAMRRAFRDRAAWLGDIDFVDVPLDELLDPAHVDPWVASFDPGRATPSEALAGDLRIAREGPETTHFSVVDAAGNAVSNTYTLNFSYGSGAVAEGTGILLNDEMDDFNLRPGHTDRRGRIGTPPNRIEPGKRMLSSMTPVIVTREGRVVLVAGSPGGRTIINTVVRILVNRLDYGMDLREAVDAGRFHHPWFPDRIVLEDGRFPDGTVARLEALGHETATRAAQGDAHCIAFDPDRGLYVGVADTRIDGAAVAAGSEHRRHRARRPALPCGVAGD